MGVREIGRFLDNGRWMPGTCTGGLLFRRRPGSGNDGTPSGCWPKDGRLRVRRRPWDGIHTPSEDGPPPLARAGLPP